ncbi:oligosaccharide flippase family protein [Cupriavidus sp. CV2]|uniref:lipopolysaccharide biosynthesis protein n=1 Tax=Cupriavidus ulmosensis TaxID=3065913 RepID=UPI00296AA3F0|nr:oligosaccharide flippase family protein [Cupriavidus sp. CV2]MDW3681727.1 oligosaccharide flippase family protein [Cupriavidus sp. CV2]
MGRLIPQNRFLRSVLALVSGTAAGQLILVLATPVLTRLYAPAEFGILAVFTAAMSMILIVSSLRYEFAIPLPKGVGSARLLLLLTLGINAAIAAASVVVVALFRDDIARLSKTPALANYLWLLPLVVLCAGSYKALNYWAVRNNDYKAIAQTKLTQSCANVATQLVSGLMGLGALGLILGQLIGLTAGTARLARGVGLRSLVGRASSSGQRFLVLLRRYHRFPKYDVPAALVDVMGTQLPNMLLAALFSPAVAGFYMLAERVLMMPMTLLAQAVGQVLLGASQDSARNAGLDRLALKVVVVLIAIVALPTLVVFWIGGDLFALIFGQSWREAGVYASWMMLGLSAQFLYSPVSILLMATEGQQLNLWINLFLLCAKAIAVWYGFHVGSPLVAIIGFSLVGMAGYAGGVLVILLHTRKHAVRVRSFRTE